MHVHSVHSVPSGDRGPEILICETASGCIDDEKQKISRSLGENEHPKSRTEEVLPCYSRSIADGIRARRLAGQDL